MSKNHPPTIDPPASGLTRRAVTQGLAGNPAVLDRLAKTLRDKGLRAVSVSAFSPLAFHNTLVKENAYLPRWDTEERVAFSQQVADVLAVFGPADEPFLSFSSLAGILKHRVTSPDTDADVARNMARVALHCHRVTQRTGRKMVMALGPEPGLTYERTDEVGSANGGEEDLPPLVLR